VSEGLLNALNRREQERVESLAGTLASRSDDDAKAVEEVLLELQRTIEAELNVVDQDIQLKFPDLDDYGRDERAQVERDVDSLRHRLDQIPLEIETETAAVRRRYLDPTPRLFPAAVEFLVPERMVQR